MTRYLLDTNIVSDAVRANPQPAISGWVADQSSDDLFIATLTIAELWRGVVQRAPGRRRDQLLAWFLGPVGPQALFRDRVLPFGVAAAIEWGRLMAEGSAAGRSRSGPDMIIAATAAAHDCVVVTANERHFAGIVDYLNPLTATA